MKLAIINESDFLVQDYLKHFLKSAGEPTSQSSVIVRNFTDKFIHEYLEVLNRTPKARTYEEYKEKIDILIKVTTLNFEFSKKWSFMEKFKKYLNKDFFVSLSPTFSCFKLFLFQYA